MKPVTQQSYNQRAPASLRVTDVPGRTISYAEATEMCRKLDVWMMRRRYGWVTGKSAFMLGTKKSLDKNTVTKDRGQK